MYEGKWCQQVITAVTNKKDESTKTFFIYFRGRQRDLFVCALLPVCRSSPAPCSSNQSSPNNGHINGSQISHPQHFPIRHSPSWNFSGHLQAATMDVLRGFTKTLHQPSSSPYTPPTRLVLCLLFFTSSIHHPIFIYPFAKRNETELSLNAQHPQPCTQKGPKIAEGTIPSLIQRK